MVTTPGPLMTLPDESEVRFQQQMSIRMTFVRYVPDSTSALSRHAVVRRLRGRLALA
jgi:hypothetical protein